MPRNEDVVKASWETWFGGGCALLAAIVIWEWLPGGGAAPVTLAAMHAAAKKVQAADAADAEGKDTDTWTETIDARPLFTIGRRPPKSRGGNGPAARSGLPRLAGIMITPYGKRAIFMPDGGKPVVLAEGGTLDDSTVRRIGVDRVFIAGPKGDLVLQVSFDRNRVVPPPIPPNGPLFQPNPPPGGFTPMFPRPGFNPAFQPQAIPRPQAANADNENGDNSNDDDSTPATPPPRPGQFMPGQPNGAIMAPGFRGPVVPRGRE